MTHDELESGKEKARGFLFHGGFHHRGEFHAQILGSGGVVDLAEVLALYSEGRTVNEGDD